MQTNAIRIDKFEEIQTDRICYFKQDNIWYIYFPSCGIGNLKNHKVTEHEDGKITVTPSILTKGHHAGMRITMHGYLTNGVWKDEVSTE